MSPGISFFRPHIIPTVTMLVLVPLFIGLGFWQLDRAGQKRQLAGTQETRGTAPVLELDSRMLDAEDVEHRMLAVSGTFIPEKSVFIENRKHQGKTGLHVISPMKIASGDRYLLVNRGWVRTPPKEEPSAAVRVTGRAVVPQPPAIKLGGGYAPASSQQRWPYFTLETYSAWSGLAVYPFMVLQSPDDDHGFVRAWVSKPVDETMHIGYALQWFAFALIVAFIWVRVSLVKQSGMEVVE